MWYGYWSNLLRVCSSHIPASMNSAIGSAGCLDLVWAVVHGRYKHKCPNNKWPIIQQFPWMVVSKWIGVPNLFSWPPDFFKKIRGSETWAFKTLIQGKMCWNLSPFAAARCSSRTSGLDSIPVQFRRSHLWHCPTARSSQASTWGGSPPKSVRSAQRLKQPVPQLVLTYCPWYD